MAAPPPAAPPAPPPSAPPAPPPKDTAETGETKTAVETTTTLPAAADRAASDPGKPGSAPTTKPTRASRPRLSARWSKSADKAGVTLKSRRANLRAELLSHGYSVANATHVPLYISLNQVGPLMYEAVSPNGVFERRAPALFFFLEVRASGDAYTPWSVAWPILAVTGPVVAITSIAAIPIAAAVTGSATLAGISASVYSGLATASASVAAAGTSVAAAGTKVASTAARLSLLPGGKKLHGKLVDAAKAHVGSLQESGTQRVLQYVTAAVAAVTGAKADEHAPGAVPKLAEIDVTGYPLDKVLACKTGKRKLDAELDAAFKKLDFRSRDFQPKTNPVLRVVGGPELEERGDKYLLVFYPLRLEHIVDLHAEPLPQEDTPPTAEEARLAKDAKLVDSWEEASIHSEDAPAHLGHDEDPKKRSWLNAWRRKSTPQPEPAQAQAQAQPAQQQTTAPK
ncbi:uncharacterized protein CcaverHIS019_0600010 [Cutaneotrichosporon cavernicola]|uniref:Uncharacterized protein n=1 Tax=Cutaneotrichosporon cavernicola TaxID=279322 RepID=A0AA48QXN7_9TREE|nr:uncharacterized protein CcaverHIS019_0600010 [Cutaneotrichosporon cavernicola]BEI93542.1 hypothetical protein CcaverHIS019_0600010 [Cutaneotrichosporon cavernicola]